MATDINGVPIHKGDLLRTFHFAGARKKKYYLYHTVVEEEGELFMVPTSHLEPSLRDGGGKCLLKYGGTECEVISGYGPEPYISYDDRPRIKPSK